MAVYTYNRVSTDKQGSSTEQQETHLADFCQRKKFYNVIKLIDEDVSGGMEILSRPQGSILKDLKDGDVLICSKRDRMFRNTINALTHVFNWLDIGVKIYFLDSGEEPITLDKPDSKFIFTVMCAKDELEKDTTSLRTKQNMKFRKENMKSYSPASFGYDIKGERDKHNKLINGTIVENKAEQEIILYIKEQNRLGFSASKISQCLNADGISSKQGGEWSRKTVRDILKRDSV